ncbi:MAG: hypothetical protein ACRD5G_13795 [Candidatus Acidiferrales bacterium]
MRASTPYLSMVWPRVPALLGQLDREPQSVNAGSFDREHWGWKFRDFPMTMLQTAVYPLALLWRHPLPGNQYHRNARVLEWIERGMRATLARQHPNGAFDSVAPFSQDHGVTLAVTHHLCETARVLGDDLPPDLHNQLRDAAQRACRFAERSREDYAFISNHQALFALAWRSAGELLRDQRYLRQARGVVDRILSRQSSDGWYTEYGGPDPGYESLGISYLAKYWQRTGDADVLESLKRSVQFLSYCVHPDGGMGGVYGSRHTSLYFPAGFEVLAPEIPLAAAIVRFVGERLAAGNVVTPATTDMHNLVPLLTSYLEAALAQREHREPLPLPCEELQGVKQFPDSGITVAGTPAYYAVANAKKGGVCRIFDRRASTLAYEDAGYLICTGNRSWISQMLGTGDPAAAGDATAAACQTTFALYRPPSATPLNFLALRILNLTLFRHAALGAWIRNRIIQRLITRARLGPLRLHRTFSFGPEAITISDSIKLTRPINVTEVLRPRSLTGIHMGSAKYFHSSDLLTLPEAAVSEMAAQLNRSGEALCSLTVRFPADGEGRAATAVDASALRDTTQAALP